MKVLHTYLRSIWAASVIDSFILKRLLRQIVPPPVQFSYPPQLVSFQVFNNYCWLLSKQRTGRPNEFSFENKQAAFSSKFWTTCAVCMCRCIFSTVATVEIWNAESNESSGGCSSPSSRPDTLRFFSKEIRTTNVTLSVKIRSFLFQSCSDSHQAKGPSFTFSTEFNSIVIQCQPTPVLFLARCVSVFSFGT